MSDSKVDIYHVAYSQLGFCLSIEGDIPGTLFYANSLGLSSLQIFTEQKSVETVWGSPYFISEEEKQEIKDVQKFFNINVFIHASTRWNLCGNISKKYLAWSEASTEEHKRARKYMDVMVNTIKGDLEISAKINKKGNGGVIVHFGNWADKKDGLKAMVTTIVKSSRLHQNIILENSCLEGNKVGGTIDDMKIVKDALLLEKISIGFCIDTCHIYQSGEYNLSEKKEIDKFFSDFDKKLGMSNLKCIHLNDSRAKFNSHYDRHAPLMEGEIWKNNPESFWYFIDICDKKKIPLIIETGEIGDIYKFWKKN